MQITGGDMKTYNTRNIMIILVIAIVLYYTAQSQAMPGFARRYKFTCQTCHAPFPKLKPYGEEFAANGFRLPEGEPSYATIDTGDPSLELTRNFPIGMRLDAYAVADKDDEVSNDLQTPILLKFISGGPIAQNLSYYFYFFFSEKGEVVGIEDAFLYYTDLLGTGINITAGQFSVSDPIYKNELRLTYESYVPFAAKPSRSLCNLKYDRGIIVDKSFDFGLTLVAEIVNGNGIDPADEHDNFDGDKYKNYFFRASQELFDVVRIGGFGYIGKEKNTADDSVTDVFTNSVSYYGGDLSIILGPFELNTLFLYRKDSNAYFTADKKSIATKGYMAELIFQPEGDRSNYVITALYNKVDSDYRESGVHSLNYESATLSLTYLLARNVKIIGEYTYLLHDYSKGEDYKNHHILKTGVSAAF